MSVHFIPAQNPNWLTLSAIENLMAKIQDEICADPPFSAANAERRGELDQLRDMIERRT